MKRQALGSGHSVLTLNQGWNTSCGSLPEVSVNSGQILSSAHGNFEGQKKVLESSIIIINYCIIIN